MCHVKDDEGIYVSITIPMKMRIRSACCGAWRKHAWGYEREAVTKALEEALANSMEPYTEWSHHLALGYETPTQFEQAYPSSQLTQFMAG
ncbi:MAG: hypothetical protein D6690_18030 [Nitrospirae bacterium]|nr:MAG: hypothetical protein D6690_18030 [Nitrospirota bacterium]